MDYSNISRNGFDCSTELVKLSLIVSFKVSRVALTLLFHAIISGFVSLLFERLMKKSLQIKLNDLIFLLRILQEFIGLELLIMKNPSEQMNLYLTKSQIYVQIHKCFGLAMTALVLFLFSPFSLPVGIICFIS